MCGERAIDGTLSQFNRPFELQSPNWNWLLAFGLVTDDNSAYYTEVLLQCYDDVNQTTLISQLINDPVVAYLLMSFAHDLPDSTGKQVTRSYGPKSYIAVCCSDINSI